MLSVADFILAHGSLLKTEPYRYGGLALNPFNGFGFLIVVFGHMFGYWKIQNAFIERPQPVPLSSRDLVPILSGILEAKEDI